MDDDPSVETSLEEGDAKDDYANMDPHEVFALFDTDGSGLINLEEFTAMLTKLNIKISDAKASKYFKLCDVDGSGEIDLEEFKVALFACDPNGGNSIGFVPNALLTPLDAFEMFDKDGSGRLDEDEFFFVLEYLKLDVSDQKQERLFSKYDKDGSGSIDYEEFKQIWLSVADVKKELSDRGIDIPKFATKRQLRRMLKRIIDDEEESEKKALAEAEQWRAWRAILEQKNVHIKKARRRAEIELTRALDAAGQLYVFGRGASRQFAADRRSVNVVGRSKISKLWTRRVTAGEDDLKKGANTLDDKEAIDADQLREELRDSPFRGLSVARNTDGLWGHRVTQCAVSDNVILALSDLGEMWSWGGVDHWWHRLEHDAYWHSHWRGHTTPRSQLLLGTKSDEEAKPPGDAIDEDEEQDQKEDKSEALRNVLTYFDAWKPPPGDVDRAKFYGDVLLPKLEYKDLKQSLEVRGKTPGDRTKRQLVDALHQDFQLEKRVLGERAHRRIRKLEEEIRDLQRRRRGALVKRLKNDVIKTWAPLREIQAEEEARERAATQTRIVEEIARRENAYLEWRQKISDARHNHEPRYRGQSIDFSASGITSRGAPDMMPQAYQAVKQVAGGAHHFAVVHQSGAVYSWGVGHSGRLGLDATQGGDPRADCYRPTLVQALEATPVVQVACGYAHTAAVTAARECYVWGSAAIGKLGVGDDAKDDECYSSVPLAISFPNRAKIRNVSCGATHTAATSTTGLLFVWGCGDGGRLGLGRDAMEHSQWTPRLVECLASERIDQVSCGNAHTLCASAVTENVWNDGQKVIGGGVVFAAGSAAVLGKFCPEFTRVFPPPDDDDLVVSQVSAGFGHSAVVTTEGELYCWGANHDGCCGQPDVAFVPEPTLVRAIYERPANLALGKPARLSSCYGGYDAHLAVDGNVDGSTPKHCASTQQDPQAWWEVDLGEFVAVHAIKVWNRTDEPNDKTMPRDKFSSRLVPSWIMVSQRPFDKVVGGDSLINALSLSVARMHITRDSRCTLWRVPDGTAARFVRVQLENFDFLHVAQVEVFGTAGYSASVGRCGFAQCGRQCTVAVVRPLSDPFDVDRAYKRAILADAHNADILRLLETYALVYDKYGRGETKVKDDVDTGCLLCTGGRQCEICEMKHVFGDELKELPLGVAGRLLTLDETAELLLNAPKPKLNYTPKKRVDKSLTAMLKRRLDLKKSGAAASTTTETPQATTTLPEEAPPIEEEGEADKAAAPEAEAEAEPAAAGGGRLSPDSQTTVYTAEKGRKSRQRRRRSSNAKVEPAVQEEEEEDDGDSKQ
ncbi:hypothetical protein CTAYLR_001943 [Chrysophaeum taylorii]|uniref:EF-hand domain-containing protein n=1 Tax=Chrysophaeum taylorii TaxID=2483200 RepID=A0AAD7UAQ2_9STRA|nr:hypothetical protein CTAYLR_001943 [Chrysophaeum taylorii]